MGQISKQSLMIISVMILFVLLFVFYFYFYQATNETIASQQNEMTTLNKEIALLERLILEKQQEKILQFDEKSVQAALPLWDNIEQLVLDLKQTEVASNAMIRTISFSQIEGNSIHQMIGESQPILPTVKELKFNLTLEGKYNEIRKWLTAIWDTPRLMVIDSLAFATPYADGNPEQNGDPDVLVANIGLTAYFDSSYLDQVKEIIRPYAEITLDDLDSELENGGEQEPVTEKPETPEKPNKPEEPKNQTGEKPTSSDQTVYVIQSGDTLFSIAMKYYGTKEAIQWIKDANGLKDNMIFTRQTLILPKPPK